MRPEMLAVERLDLDHVGAHVAQDLAGCRAGNDLREVEDERVGEGKHERGIALVAAPGQRCTSRLSLRNADLHVLQNMYF